MELLAQVGVRLYPKWRGAGICRYRGIESDLFDKLDHLVRVIGQSVSVSG
jgi:hypothetical protein